MIVALSLYFVFLKRFYLFMDIFSLHCITVQCSLLHLCVFWASKITSTITTMRLFISEIPQKTAFDPIPCPPPVLFYLCQLVVVLFVLLDCPRVVEKDTTQCRCSNRYIFKPDLLFSVSVCF